MPPPLYSWTEHAELCAIGQKRRLLSGPLFVLVDTALKFKDGLDDLFIELDSGPMFCTNEIRLLSIDGTRPTPTAHDRQFLDDPA